MRRTGSAIFNLEASDDCNTGVRSVYLSWRQRRIEIQERKRCVSWTAGDQAYFDGFPAHS